MASLNEIDRRTALKQIFGTLASLGILGVGLKSDSPPPAVQNETTNLEIKATRFNEAVTQVAKDLGWRVKTAPAESSMAGKCLSFNKSADWIGCLSSFAGFETPQRPPGFQPTGYLVYAYGDYLSDKDSGQRLFVYPKLIEGLPIRSESRTFGDLLSTFEEQRDISRQFGFKFPDTIEEFYQMLGNVQNPPRGEIGVIGYWGLSDQELSKIGVLYINLP